jgi:glycosyltransferase involved in cell wall biosynthesis
LLRRRWKTDVDILHNTFYLPRGLGDYPRGKRIVTVHDMIPEVFPKTRRRLDFLTRKHEYLQQADHIICVSEATKNDLLRIYNDIETPISVVYSGVSADFTQGVARDARLPERYVLFVGNRRGYKDARTALEAFARIAPEYPDLHLLMVGGGGFSRDEQALVNGLGVRGRVQQRTVSDADMPNAYANAEMFVFPSRYEGFGLPALEAMASGTPAVLCHSSSLPEVGGDAAVYFELGNTDDLAKKMKTLLDEPSIRDHHIALGLQRSAVFSWQRTAQETLAVYAKALTS